MWDCARLVRPALALLLVVGCDNYPLEVIRELVDATPVVVRAPDAGPRELPRPDLAPDAPADLPANAPAPPPPPPAPPPSPPPPPTPGCNPSEEVCNAIDDDCDGKVDEDLPAIPCPNGGSRYCVAGRLSECPKPCDVCRPGSRRICFISYCTYWGTQACMNDGRSFESCKEAPVPPECAAVSKSKRRSPELERCCIDNGYCCLDEFDLDGDGNRAEMLGRCGAVTCTP